MTIDSKDETILEERAEQLALARTAALSPSGTITPRTLARTADAGAPAEPPAAAPDGLAPALDLPKISIDERAGALDARSSPRAGRREYAIVATLGEGGMGRVHLARQRALDRDVALKTLKPGAPPTVAAALLREARLTGMLEHPGVIPVHMLGVDESGRPMIVMKRVDGVELSALIDDPLHSAWTTRGRSDDRLVAGLEILTQVCRTVEFAHSRGVIHRDIKPENVMIGSFGEVYLLDWGIAKAKDEPVDPRSLVGTPSYMAPEMVRGGPVDERTDVYLIGATLHEMLSGRPRHDATNVMQAIRSALESTPVVYGADVPEALARIVNKASARVPEDRFESAAALREALAAFLRYRSARTLTEAALERLDSLDAMLAAAGPERAPADLPGAYRLATESRFGLVQSIREHSTDDDAQRAMRRCLALSIELELRQEHADSADALLREMDGPDAELAARIAGVRERAKERARNHERLETLERELDPAAQGSRRIAPILGLGLVSLLTGVLVAVGWSRMPGPGVAVALMSGVLVLVLAGLFAIRRTMMVNAFNRRAAGILVLSCAAFLVDRIIGFVTGMTVPWVLGNDLLLMLVILGAAGITLTARLAWSTPIVAVALVANHVWPDRSPWIFSAAVMLVLVVIAWALPRRHEE